MFEKENHMTSEREHPFVHRLPVRDRSGKVVAEKEVVSYRGLLDLAHRDGLRRIETHLVQVPSKDNGEMAIVRAEVETCRGRFSGIGDASPESVHARMVPHLIRFAETRAEARALRKAVNIGVVALEELGEDLSDASTYDGQVLPTESPATEARASETTAPATRPNGSPSGPSDSQRRYLFRLLELRGIEGEAAREYLHRELGVTSLDDAARSKIAKLIDRLVHEGNGSKPSASNGGTEGRP